MVSLLQKPVTYNFAENLEQMQGSGDHSYIIIYIFVCHTTVASIDVQHPQSIIMFFRHLSNMSLTSST